MEPQQVYSRRENAYRRLQAKQQRTAHRLSNYRLYTILAGLFAALVLYRIASRPAGLALALVTLVAFGYLAILHYRVRARLRYAQALGALNRTGVERTEGRWSAFPDAGADFRDDDHPFASDLDLFGQGSLFQWTNAAQTGLGRETLAGWLKRAPAETAEVTARQEAVTELAGRLAWRQRFAAEGLVVRERLEPTERLMAWAKETHPQYLRPGFILAVRLLPAATILLLLLYAVGAVPWQVPALLAALQAGLLKYGGKERSRVLSAAYRLEASLRTYAQMVALFENRRFAAPWLQARQSRLRDGAGRSAHAQIRRLTTIAQRISNRENAFFIFLNILTLWDYQCMIALEGWKRESGRALPAWLEALAEVEALSSLATIRFEHPAWATPTVTEHGGISARQLGHPLITKGRVCNDFELVSPARIAMITGSNMSGKSTFLRTVGINLVLAYCGAPVCAEQFRCSPLRLWTSMRVGDNLEQSISSFYAELLRIKRIVEAASGESPVCFLLDEIFKGTNSHDRHEGAKALITQLQKAGAYGLVSTHDLELGELERESGGGIRNYHFREHYRDGEIHFDFTLRTGISTTRNALYLIKLIGIKIE